jgi:hypothetical protein
MDPRQNVNTGDPIRLAASQINGLNRLLTPNAGFSAQTAGEPPTPYTWVMAKNNTGSTIPRWGVLAITGMDISPASGANAASQYQQMPVVAGGTPSDTTTSWCVAVEPIAAGAIGRVAVGGCVQVKVEVADSAHTFVRCKSSSSELKSTDNGEGLILWKQGTGSGQWALVRLGNGRGTQIDVVTNVTLGATGIAVEKKRAWVYGPTGITGSTIGTTGCT